MEYFLGCRDRKAKTSLVQSIKQIRRLMEATRLHATHQELAECTKNDMNNPRVNRKGSIKRTKSRLYRPISKTMLVLTGQP